jgi:hypothetical protein
LPQVDVLRCWRSGDGISLLSDDARSQVVAPGHRLNAGPAMISVNDLRRWLAELIKLQKYLKYIDYIESICDYD